jgi:hypothetical protein
VSFFDWDQGIPVLDLNNGLIRCGLAARCDPKQTFLSVCLFDHGDFVSLLLSTAISSGQSPFFFGVLGDFQVVSLIAFPCMKKPAALTDCGCVWIER